MLYPFHVSTLVFLGCAVVATVGQKPWQAATDDTAARRLTIVREQVPDPDMVPARLGQGDDGFLAGRCRRRECRQCFLCHRRPGAFQSEQLAWTELLPRSAAVAQPETPPSVAGETTPAPAAPLPAS
jgi:hypothetical protein